MNYQTAASVKTPNRNHTDAKTGIASPAVIRINSRQITAILFVFMFILIAFSLVGDYLFLHYPPGNHLVDKYIEFFYLNNENNLPTLFSVVLLFTAALLNFAIGMIAARDTSAKAMKWYWYALGFIFVFLGIDESLQIHDMLSHTGAVEKVSKESSFFYYGWAVPYAAGVLVVGFLFLRFLFRLPVNTRNRFMIAGIIYVGGALGLEFIESWAHVHYGKDGLLERTLCTIEETMEMTGNILFIYTLLDYIGLAKAKFSVGKPDVAMQASSISVAE